MSAPLFAYAPDFIWMDYTPHPGTSNSHLSGWETFFLLLCALWPFLFGIIALIREFLPEGSAMLQTTRQLVGRILTSFIGGILSSLFVHYVLHIDHPVGLLSGVVVLLCFLLQKQVHVSH